MTSGKGRAWFGVLLEVLQLCPCRTRSHALYTLWGAHPIKQTKDFARGHTLGERVTFCVTSCISVEPSRRPLASRRFFGSMHPGSSL